MSSSKQSSSRLNGLNGSKLNPRGGSKLMNRSMNRSKMNKRYGSDSQSKSRIESRFMSRMKSSMTGKYKSGLRRKGSSKIYSVVRENGDPIIWRDNVDVTPLPIQINDDSLMNNYNNNNIHFQSHSENDLNEIPKCFIPLISKIYHPLSLNGIHEEKKEKEKDRIARNNNNNNNNFRINIDELNINNKNKINNTKIDEHQNHQNDFKNKIIFSYSNDNEIDIIQNKNKFNEYIQTNPQILDENINVNLVETDTKILFEMPSLAISNRESSLKEKENITEINKNYKFCLLKHSDKDLFTSSETQTYNPPLKEQSISVIPPKTTTKSTQSSKFDIYDSFKNNKVTKINNNLKNNENETMEKSISFKKNLMIMERAIVQNVLAEKQMLYRIHSENHNNNNENNEFDTDDDDDDDDNVEHKEIDEKLKKKEEKPKLSVQIDIIPIDPTNQKINEKSESKESAEITKKSSFKQSITDDSSSSISVPHLQSLWKYSYSDLNDLWCTSLDFNPLNNDLIVSGYGSWDFNGNGNQNGKIMFWTLKNPNNPSRIYHIENNSVISLNFSRIHPYLLSVGLFDGNVAIYDIRIESNEPILKSTLNSNSNDNSKKENQSSSSKHTTPVWNVTWEKPIHNNNNNNNNKDIEKEKEKETESKEENNNNNDESSKVVSTKLHQMKQKLFSIASDGIIKEWSMKKGFISSNIMSLKRVPNLAALKGSIIDNTIRSRQASGLCFDFAFSSNNTQYYVGTEDGIIHKCSISYNEQVLRTYYGHNGPVYNIQCSPFDYNIFITCSADWTIKIWNQSKSSPLLSLKSNVNESVIDCCWSPFNSTIFASASENGILSIWNLQKNKKDPVITKDTKNPITKIIFAPNSPVILSSHKNGTIQVYRLNNINTKLIKTDESNTSQINKLNKVLETDNEKVNIV